MTFDSTGCFHWCSARDVDECTLTRSLHHHDHDNDHDHDGGDDDDDDDDNHDNDNDENDGLNDQARGDNDNVCWPCDCCNIC